MAKTILHSFFLRHGVCVYKMKASVQAENLRCTTKVTGNLAAVMWLRV